LEPFYINTAINLNTCYTPAYKQEPFKYNVATLVSKLIFTANPLTIADFYEFLAYKEMYSYYKTLNRFKPLMRIQVFIDMRNKQRGVLSPDQEKKRKAVVKDWFRLIIWFIRIRKASKTGQMHSSLLDIASRVNCPTVVIQDPKRALLNTGLLFVDQESESV